MRYLLYLSFFTLLSPAATMTIERVALTAQSVSSFGTSFAQVLGPFELRPDLLNSATFHSGTVCVAGTPGCPTTGAGIRAGRTRIRFTDLDVTCDLDVNCASFGIGFAFVGVAEGPFVFRFQLANVETDPIDAVIRGNIAMELKVGDVFQTKFLSFNTADPTTWGPTAAIPLFGRPTPFTAFGTMIVSGMPAGSALRLLHSAEFDFESVPEPSAFGLAGIGLAGLLIFRRAAK